MGNSKSKGASEAKSATSLSSPAQPATAPAASSSSIKQGKHEDPNASTSKTTPSKTSSKSSSTKKSSSDRKSPRNTSGRNSGASAEKPKGDSAKQPSSSSSKPQGRLESLYNKYKEPGADTIEASGVMKFLADIDVAPEDVVTLVIAYHLDSQEMGIFTQEEFVGGFAKLGLDSVEKIKAYVPKFRGLLDSDDTLHKIYNFAFEFYKDNKDKQHIDIDTATAILGLLMNKRPHVHRFQKFLKNQTQYKALNWDQWSLLFDFVRQVKDDFSNYEPDGAWPVLMDMYVDWVKESGDGDQATSDGAAPDDGPAKKPEKESS